MKQNKFFNSSNIQLLSELFLTNKSIIDRQLTENFIHEIFSQFYGADIQHFLPFLLRLTNSESQIIAALGFRPAVNNDLFLENYLQKPIEQILAGIYKQPVVRQDVVEIGNLAIGERGAARVLIVALTGVLFAARYRWCVFTIARPLINTFRKMGIELETLSPANNDFMNQEEKNSWGSYYQQNPFVMACRVEQAYKVLVEYVIEKDSLINIWLDAQQVGNRV